MTLQERVYELAMQSVELTASGVSEALGVTKRQANNALLGLKGKGKLDQVRIGYYRIGTGKTSKPGHKRIIEELLEYKPVSSARLMEVTGWNRKQLQTSIKYIRDTWCNVYSAHIEGEHYYLLYRGDFISAQTK